MAVVALIVTHWHTRTVLIGHEQYSAYGYLVTCKFGIYAETGRVEQVKHARDKFGPFWSIPNDALATVGGMVVDDDHPLSDGDVLEFHRR